MSELVVVEVQVECSRCGQPGQVCNDPMAQEYGDVFGVVLCEDCYGDAQQEV